MEKKKFLQMYGPMFVGGYILAFIFLVTVGSKVEFPLLPGDIRIGGLYLPIVGAGAVSAFVVAFLEMYKFTKKL